MSAVRFVLALLLFLVSVLIFIPAPILAVWQWKLAALEYGHWIAIGPLVLILAGRRRSVLDSISVGMSVLALLFFLSSGVRASLFASTAVSKMNAAFPAPDAALKKTKPFSFFQLWTGSTPPEVEVQTVEFAQYEGGVKLNIDFYPAQDRADAPCVVVVHTGGWDSGVRTEFASFNRWLSKKGYAVAAVDYRLAPKWTWPRQREDVLAAIGFLQARAKDFGIDPNRFILFGRSAGGQIAEAVAAAGDHPGVVGCIAFYAPADMKFAFEYAKKSDILNSDQLLRQYLGGAPTDVAENYESASPYLFADEKTPPTLLIHGGNDELVWVMQSQRYSDKLRSLGVRSAFLRLPWATHAFDHNLNGPGGQIATWAVERFLANVTAPATE